MKLLNGGLDYTTSGVASTAIDSFQINAAKLPDNGYNTIAVQVTGSAALGEVDFSGASITSAVTIEVAGNAGTEQISFAAGAATSAISFAVNQLADATGVSATVSGGTLRFTSTSFGSDQYVSIKSISGTFTEGKAFGEDAKVNINGAQAEVHGLVATVRSNDLDISLTLDKDFAQNTTSTSSFAVTGGGARFQIGSNVNRQGQIQIGVGSVTTSKLGDSVVGFLSSLSSGWEQLAAEREHDPVAEDPHRRDQTGRDVARPTGRAPEGRAGNQRQQSPDRTGERDRQRKRDPRRGLRD